MSVGSCDIDPCHRTACPPNLVSREGWEEHCCLDDTDSEGIHVYLKRIEPDRIDEVKEQKGVFISCCRVPLLMLGCNIFPNSVSLHENILTSPHVR